MKNNLILTAAAVLSLASCQKTEPVGSEFNAPDREIIFSTYTGRAVTKGDPAVYGNAMKVTAFFNDGQAKYFDNRDFTCSGGNYTTSPAVYWPVSDEGTALPLDFYAVSSTSGYEVTASTTSTHNDTKTIVVDTSSPVTGTDDLVAGILSNKKKGDSDLVINLGHKLTKVAFKAVGADTKLKYVITGVTLKAMSTGTYTFGASEGWSGLGTPKTDYAFTLTSSTVTLDYGTAGFTSLGASGYGLMLLSGQSSADSTVTATFTYSVYEKKVTAGETSDVEIFTGTKTVDLSASASSDWGVNKSIVYKVTLPTGGDAGDNAIKFDGEIGDWGDDQDVTVTFPKP